MPPSVQSRASRRSPPIPTEVVSLDHGTLRLVVVADTHGQPHARSHAAIAAERPDRILHAGDVGDLGVLEGLARIAPVIAVRGNIDVHARGLPDERTIEVHDGSEPWLRILLLHIGVNGPKLRADVARRAHATGASVVICGHSHVPFIGRDRDLTVFNPGSIGPRRFHLPIVFGVLTIADGRVDMKHVDCETGHRWMP
ncbi:MAG: metallophosphoesterase family protein [Deltaproteobacteria bacterium]|nr:metallophosphoesterase family protein [Deltaproteobacteria bacterium]